MSEIDASQLSPQIRQYIEDQIRAAKAADAAANAPKELTPQEKVDAALAGVDAAERRERVGPGHNDHIVGAIVTYLHAVYDRDSAAATHDEEQPAPSGVDTSVNSNPASANSADASAVGPTAAPAGD